MTIPASMFFGMAREEQTQDPARRNRIWKNVSEEALASGLYQEGPLLDAFVNGIVTALYVQEIRERFTPQAAPKATPREERWEDQGHGNYDVDVLDKEFRDRLYSAKGKEILQSQERGRNHE